MDKATDVVCNMQVEINDKILNYKYKDKTYYFCSQHCMESFKSNPDKYLTKKEENLSDCSCNSSKVGVKYYCPMLCEGEKLYDNKGDCPICGMALVPVGLQVSEKLEKEDYYLNKRNFWISLIFVLPSLLISMDEMFFINSFQGDFFASFFNNAKNLQYIELLLSLPVCLYLAFPVYKKMILSIKTLNFNMFSLIGVGTLIAFIYSLFAVFLPNIFPSYILKNGVVPVYFETSSVIIMFYFLGQALEKRSQFSTKKAILSLIDLSAKEAVLIKDGKDTSIKIDEVRIGDLLRIRQGDKIPVDGILVDGALVVNESSISGESIPVNKTIGSKVIGGTVNTTGSGIMEVEASPEDSMLSQIIKITLEAGQSKAKIQRIADRVTKFFVPLVALIAIASFLGWIFFDNTTPLSHAILACVSVFVIACPCALGLATPMAITVATSKASQLGLLFKNANALENLAKIKVLVVDKTGTLTEGKAQVENLLIEKKENKNKILNYIYEIERTSAHPVAEALLKYIESENITHETLNFKSIKEKTGKGMYVELEDDSVFISSKDSLQELEFNTDINLFIKNTLENSSSLIVFNSKKLGFALFSINDAIKESSYKAIKELKNRGIEIVMASGDNYGVAHKVAKELGIKEFHAEVKPIDKLKIIEQIQNKNKLVAMLGDGINDAPALAKADVSIAMANGSDIAIQSSDVTLFNGDLSKLKNAIVLSKQTIKIIKQNLAFSFVYNFLGVILASGVLYPFLGVFLNPMLSALAMALSSVSVVLSSLRLNLFKIEE